LNLRTSARNEEIRPTHKVYGLVVFAAKDKLVFIHSAFTKSLILSTDFFAPLHKGAGKAEGHFDQYFHKMSSFIDELLRRRMARHQNASGAESRAAIILIAIVVE
jgi:hypothetical protein